MLCTLVKQHGEKRLDNRGFPRVRDHGVVEITFDASFHKEHLYVSDPQYKHNRKQKTVTAGMTLDCLKKSIKADGNITPRIFGLQY